VETKVADFTVSFDQFNQQAYAAIVTGIKMTYPEAKFERLARMDETTVVYAVYLHGG
jgi:hypothetical protein